MPSQPSPVSVRHCTSCKKGATSHQNAPVDFAESGPTNENPSDRREGFCACALASSSLACSSMPFGRSACPWWHRPKFGEEVGAGTPLSVKLWLNCQYSIVPSGCKNESGVIRHCWQLLTARRRRYRIALRIWVQAIN